MTSAGSYSIILWAGQKETDVGAPEWYRAATTPPHRREAFCYTERHKSLRKKPLVFIHERTLPL